MKFCPRKTHEYKNSLGVETTVHYITPDMIEQYHGSEFYKQFNEFAKNLPTTFVHGQSCYFYPDYQHIARRTQQFLLQD